MDGRREHAAKLTPVKTPINAAFRNEFLLTGDTRNPIILQMSAYLKTKTPGLITRAPSFFAEN
jgi:hypothetical protein